MVEEVKRKRLLDICKNRWAEQHRAYKHFYQAYVFIAESLELIGYKQHVEKYGTTYSDWYTTSRSNAQQLLAAMKNYCAKPSGKMLKGSLATKYTHTHIHCTHLIHTSQDDAGDNCQLLYMWKMMYKLM